MVSIWKKDDGPTEMLPLMLLTPPWNQQFAPQNQWLRPWSFNIGLKSYHPKRGGSFFNYWFLGGELLNFHGVEAELSFLKSALCLFSEANCLASGLGPIFQHVASWKPVKIHPFEKQNIFETSTFCWGCLLVWQGWWLWGFTLTHLLSRIGVMMPLSVLFWKISADFS